MKDQVSPVPLHTLDQILRRWVPSRPVGGGSAACSDSLPIGFDRRKSRLAVGRDEGLDCPAHPRGQSGASETPGPSIMSLWGGGTSSVYSPLSRGNAQGIAENTGRSMEDSKRFSSSLPSNSKAALIGRQL